MKAILALALVLAAACGGGEAAPSPAPTGASPGATATARASATPIVLPSFAQVSASPSAAWVLVAGTRLFRSTDRGGTWDERSLPPLARDPAISFVSDREGWLASVDAAASTCASRQSVIWHTIDGAATWQQLTATGITAPACWASVSFTDAQHGFVAALDEMKGPIVFRTADGGRTWSASGPLGDPPGLPMQGGRADLRLGPVRAFGSTLLVTATVAATSGPSTHVYRSQDGVATWAFGAAIPSAGSLAVVSASRWLRIGAAGVSFESTDAGATWHAFATDYAQAAPIAPEIIFADAGVGYATVRGGLQRTVDGGTHWTTLKTPGTE